MYIYVHILIYAPTNTDTGNAEAEKDVLKWSFSFAQVTYALPRSSINYCVWGIIRRNS